MEQQLIIAPMFERIAVDARNFRVPVADEDTDGDVAQFKSGTFATGIADATNVPTTNQNTISAVTFTPHKFMATTHLAKDERGRYSASIVRLFKSCYKSIWQELLISQS